MIRTRRKRASRALLSGATAFAVAMLGLVAAGPAHAAETNYVSGVVVDERGPVSGAVVTVTDVASGFPRGTLRTAADGRFRIGGLASLQMRITVTAAQQYLPAQPVLAMPEPIENFGLRLQLTTGASIRGRVINPNGSSIGGDSVYLRAGEPHGSGMSARTDANGEYSFVGLKPGRYYLEYSAVGDYLGTRHGGTTDEWVPLDVSGAMRLEDVVLYTMLKPLVAPSITSGQCRVGATATASAGQWPEGTAVSTKWQVQYAGEGGEDYPEDIPGASGSSYTIPADLLRQGNFLRLQVTASLTGYATNVLAAQCYIYKGPKPALISPPTASGNPKVGETVTVTPGVWSVQPTSTEYSWRADQLALGPLSASRSLVVPTSAAGKGSLYVWEKPTFFGYDSPDPVRSASLGPVATGAPLAATVNPTIRGVTRYGGVMTINPGTWNQPGATFSYRWSRDGSPVATGSTYASLPTDIGHRFTVEVTASKPGFQSATVTTTRVTIRPALAPTMAAAPVVHGTAQVGRILTVTYGTWSDLRTATTFQWLRDGEPIPGETSGAHQVGSADVGHTLSIRLTGSRPGHETGVSASVPSAPVVKAAAPRANRAPAVSGTATVARTLSADPGQWNRSGLRFSYQWLRDGKAITGATSSTYTLVGADWTHRIAVRVTATSASYATAAATSAATVPVTKGPAPVNSTAPSISGRTAVGSTLTGYNGAWNNPRATYSYQWMRNGEPIADARAKTYTLTTADRGDRISLRVTAVARGYFSASAMSGRTAAIEAALTGALVPTR